MNRIPELEKLYESVEPNVKSMWQPINTAPKDGTVILTDEGTVCYVDQQHWGSPVTNGWYLCSPNSHPEQGNSDYEIFPLSPKIWMPMPELP